MKYWKWPNRESDGVQRGRECSDKPMSIEPFTFYEEENSVQKTIVLLNHIRNICIFIRISMTNLLGRKNHVCHLDKEENHQEDVTAE